MKKRLMFILLAVCVLAILLSGCAAKRNEEYVSNSTRIVTLGEGDKVTYQIEYIKGDKMYAVSFSPLMRPSLDWLKANTGYSEKVLTWWDNGHVIQGYARRQPLAFTPCSEIISTTASGSWNAGAYGALSDCALLTNIAYALLADTSVVTQGIMNQNGAKWVFVTKEDKLKTAGMAKLLGESTSKFLDESGQVPGDVQHKVLYQMINGAEVRGFKMAYSDDFVNIYQLTG